MAPRPTALRVAPSEVHDVLSRHMLADGYDIVMDLEKPRLLALRRDARPQRPRLLHQLRVGARSATTIPRCDTPEFRDRIAAGGGQQARQLRHLHDLHGRVRRDLRAHACRPAFRNHLFFIEGGALGSRTPSRPPSTGRCARTSRPATGREGHAVMHFRAGLPRPHRLHALADEHRPAQDAVLPEVRLAARSTTRSSTSRSPTSRSRDVEAAERAGDRARSRQALRRAQRRHRGVHHGADPGRGRRQPLPPRVLPRRCASCATRTRCCSSSTRCSPASASPARCGLPALRRRAGPLRLRQEDAGLRLRRQPRASTRSDNVFKVSSRINSTWGGNLADMVRCSATSRSSRRTTWSRTPPAWASGCSPACAASRGSSRARSPTPGGRGLFLAFDLPDAETRNARSPRSTTATCWGSPRASAPSASARR